MNCQQDCPTHYPGQKGGVRLSQGGWPAEALKTVGGQWDPKGWLWEREKGSRGLFQVDGRRPKCKVRKRARTVWRDDWDSIMDRLINLG